MSKNSRSTFSCADCGYEVTKWVGRCPSCHAWGTIEESAPPRTSARTIAATPSAPAKPIAEVDLESARARATGLAELDRVLGGGFVPGAVVLLAGEPGVGKSTLLLEAAHRWANATQDGELESPALYVTGEESAGQVRLRAERTNALHPSLYLGADSDLGAVLGHVDSIKPGLLIVDSVQTIHSSDVEGSPGGVTQVRAVATSLIALAKERGIPVVLVGHVTKDGSVAGPRVLEHLVDVVLQFEGDRHSTLRLLRAAKNRFGPSDEVGCFEQRDEGIVEVPDPSGLFLNRQESMVSGTAITVVVEGKRPMLAEIQSLLMSTKMNIPRRSVSGLDSARLDMTLAVLEKRNGLTTSDKEVFAATVGGMRVIEPAADLAVALAVASARQNTPLPPNMIAIGEVGLAGEVRTVGGVGRRLTEAARMGFDHALVPRDPGPVPQGIRTTVVEDVDAALRVLRRRR